MSGLGIPTRQIGHSAPMTIRSPANDAVRSIEDPVMEVSQERCPSGSDDVGLLYLDGNSARLNCNTFLPGVHFK